MATSRASVFEFLKQELRLRSVLIYAIVFLSCFGTAKIGQYSFYGLRTSPALIWPPYGLALGAILVGGYRMWLPIALAELLATYSIGTSPLPVVLAATVAQTLQPLVGAWILRKFAFDGNLSRISDAFMLIGVAILIATITPTILVPVQFATHTLQGVAGVSWVREWASGILDILILTPLITAWLPPRPFSLRSFEIIETCLALFLLAADVAFLTWSPYVAEYGLTGVYLLLAILVWIAIRMEPRILTLALLILTVLAVGGALHTPSTTPLNQELFAEELFIEFIAIIYLVVSALAEERRRARIALERNVVQLQRAIQKIEGEDVAKNQFIATLAHELRNPLAPVVSALDLLSLQDPSPEAAQTIEGAQRELGVMRRLLDDILDVARVSQPRFKLQTELIDVRGLLERCVASTKNFLRNRRHTLVVSLPDDSVTVRVDPVRFEQIVVNLLNNAGKYTPPGGRIELSCKKEGSRAVIIVRDNGIGIPMESLSEIFEPFRQIRTTPQMGTGLGIGLWLTKRLVEMHGGTIEAKSEGREQGSRFAISLPLEEGPVPEVSKTRTSTPVLPPFKILVVDDNEAAAQAMQKLLRLKGNDVQVAYEGASAIRTAPDFDPQVMLLDIGLPDMSGYELAQEFRKQGSKATLVALTGFGQEEDKEHAKQAGFDYHLTKPVGIADVESILARLGAARQTETPAR